jgi:hypothetical protein
MLSALSVSQVALPAIMIGPLSRNAPEHPSIRSSHNEQEQEQETAQQGWPTPSDHSAQRDARKLKIGSIA